MPELAPLLATTSGRKGSQSSLTQNVLLRPDVAFASGVLVLLLTVLAFYKEVVYLEDVMIQYPVAFILLPISGIGALALILPMFVFLCFREDFLHTNIVYPKHYFYVFRRTYSTVLQNNGKV
mmetsp:Transcript_4618/g.8100  ORF Transcript_4618/g.8100 Transcript_4618/m.8100 type:complete len:122 (-) Transcript_4618:473-838(-)